MHHSGNKIICLLKRPADGRGATAGTDRANNQGPNGSEQPVAAALLTGGGGGRRTEQAEQCREKAGGGRNAEILFLFCCL